MRSHTWGSRWCFTEAIPMTLTSNWQNIFKRFIFQLALLRFGVKLDSSFYAIKAHEIECYAWRGLSLDFRSSLCILVFNYFLCTTKIVARQYIIRFLWGLEDNLDGLKQVWSDLYIFRSTWLMRSVQLNLFWDDFKVPQDFKQKKFCGLFFNETHTVSVKICSSGHFRMFLVLKCGLHVWSQQPKLSTTLLNHYCWFCCAKRKK